MYHPLKRDPNGRWTRKNNILIVLYFIFMAFIFCAYAWKVGHNQPIIPPAQAEQVETCRQMESGTYLCDTTESNLMEWNAYLENQLKAMEVSIGVKKPVQVNSGPLKTYLASVSWYSRADSCHNMVGRVCLTAIGRDTKEGTTVACPKRLKLGTRVHIEGIGERVCEDRYADWVQERNGDTFDVFTEDYDEAVRFGRKNLKVTIL
ncbi:MAG: 3D domain-containing protein [Candidatus Paceibacterota bacterium]|jgi:3D (Asp-Asp-Asp) domain-containing protein